MAETSETERPDGEVPGRVAWADPAGDPAAPPAVVVDDLTIEDVSIDGMCGVY